jgi:hypothetical protein
MLAEHFNIPKSTVYQYKKEKRDMLMLGFLEKIRSGEIPDPRAKNDVPY